MGQRVVRRDHQPAQERSQREVDRRLEGRHPERLHVDSVAAVTPELPGEAGNAAQLAHQLAQPPLPSPMAGQHREQSGAVARLEAGIVHGHDGQVHALRERAHELHPVGIAAREALDQQHPRARVHHARRPGSRFWARSCASIQR